MRSPGLLLTVLMLAGCAPAVATFPTQSTSYWGYQESLAAAPGVEVTTWAPTSSLCEVLKATEVAEGKNPRAAATTFTDCRPVTVVNGGLLWGYTIPSFPGYGKATTQDICNMLRRTSRVAVSMCSPVTVVRP